MDYSSNFFASPEAACSPEQLKIIEETYQVLFAQFLRNSNEAQAFLSRGGQVIVRMRGLPYDCTSKQIIEFFAQSEPPIPVLDDEEGVLFVKKPDGRATGDAFVLFATEEAADRALSKHREIIGTRYIELFRSSTAEVQQVLNRTMKNKAQEIQYLTTPNVGTIPQVPLIQPLMQTQQPEIGARKDCIRLRGLPYEAQVEHILEFLGEHAKSIVYQGVHMIYNDLGQPSGEAFIQMDSEQSAFVCATQRHHRYLIISTKQRYIEVFQCSLEDMLMVLHGLQSPLPTQSVPGLTQTPAPQIPVSPTSFRWPADTAATSPLGATFPSLAHLQNTMFYPNYATTANQATRIPTGPTFDQIHGHLLLPSLALVPPHLGAHQYFSPMAAAVAAQRQQMALQLLAHSNDRLDKTHS